MTPVRTALAILQGGHAVSRGTRAHEEAQKTGYLAALGTVLVLGLSASPGEDSDEGLSKLCNEGILSPERPSWDESPRCRNGVAVAPQPEDQPCHVRCPDAASKSIFSTIGSHGVMAAIRPIEGSSIHRIQSGQVIVDLSSVVKELVENSLDAGAASIDVRFKNSGLDAVEVQDNGSGISPDDYESVALKHCTSKLRGYDDLLALQTFGFRGEALSSLCALSNVQIVTAREGEAPKGSRLEFESSGKLKASSTVAATRGTTVSVENIFRNLPVRRQELEKNIKREYAKVLNLLQAYACISTTARISVSNVAARGKKAVVFATKGSQTTRENIANVFGARALSALIPLDLEFEMERTFSIHRKDDDGHGRVRVLGHVSRPVTGEGRQLPDRQMFFVNSRPCGLPQMAKVFNEVYKTYNLNQSPFIFADVLLDANAYDVNVSPDKRTIILQDQAALLESLRSSLVELFEKQQQTVPSTPALNKTLSYKPLTIKRTPSLASKVSPLEECPSCPDSVAHSESQVSAEEAETLSSDPNGQANSPISHFLDRKVEARRSVGKDTIKRNSTGDVLSADERKFAREEARIGGVPDETDSERGTMAMNVVAMVRKGEDVAVHDFNRQIGVVAPEQAKEDSRASVDSEEVFGSPNESAPPEEPIPTLSSTPKPKPGIVQNAFDRMRPHRTPLQEATISIGDKTQTTVIGNGNFAWRVSRNNSPAHSVNFKDKSASSTERFGIQMQAFALSGPRALNKARKCDKSQSLDAEEAEDGDTDEAAQSRDHDGESIHESGESSSEEKQSLLGGEAEEGLLRHRLEEDGDSVIESGAEQDSQITGQDSDISDGEGADAVYLDEETIRTREDAKVLESINQAEERAGTPTADELNRANKLLKGGHKDSTLYLEQSVNTRLEQIIRKSQDHAKALVDSQSSSCSGKDDINDQDASPEERLSLTISKEDFSSMQIIGQFNLGFIIALRPGSATATSPLSRPAQLFIIDQHASDEKFNFERLQETTVVQNQRLVHPADLELTAIEEELVIEHQDILVKNGFLVHIDTSGDLPVGRRCKLLTLPMSREVTFSTRDLESLLALLADYHPPTSAHSRAVPSQTEAPTSFQQPRPTETAGVGDLAYIPRPSSIRRMFAMRACRSSVMIGKSLNKKQMERLVRNMGTMDKPWSCPHGRPTMRHLGGLCVFGQHGEEDDGTGTGMEDAVERPWKWTSWIADRDFDFGDNV